MEANSSLNSTRNASSLRWKILKRAILGGPSSNSDNQSEVGIQRISRKATHSFNLIPCRVMKDSPDEILDSSLSEKKQLHNSRDAVFCYTLPVANSPQLLLHQRVDDLADLSDFEVCNKYDIDNTGLVYIQHNINANSGGFGSTEVKPLMLHWGQDKDSNFSNKFDIIIASDCTFFKEFHQELAETIKLLLKKEVSSEAILFSPKRGDSLDKFLLKVKDIGLRFSVEEIFHAEVWKRHQGFVNGDDSWPNYEMDHCYPLLVRITG
ncbi:PREDICTED: uncharacterized protein LOC109207155 isoform X2 [Nicotiana attenuata]|uniref:uncharacterized protein LOC109207155 isoform X2 n=1 Tax=Nicotiana attenuata TaxID=49451 RepID=UPI0009053DB1|nr:PREDICTED: uncharacterized protein LOC109207155 isoform X2 [Nicotiana attenuata]